MRILIINWRSLKDPLAGGAELATFEHAKRWVKNHNATVYWLSPPYDGKKNETIEGVNFIYAGRPIQRKLSSLLVNFPIFYASVVYTYFSKFRNKVDLVIDEIHGVPFFTPLYVKEKKLLFVCEVAGEIWDKMYPKPINYIGKGIEKFTYRLYSKFNIPMVAISQSTKDDILNLGVNNNLVKVVYCGMDKIPLLKNIKKEKDLTIIFLNRLVKMKGIERAIEIFYEVQKTNPNAKFWIVGKGEDEYVEYLKKIILNKNITNKVKFWGFVSHDQKIELLRKSTVLLNTSYKEGWGLVNLEANTQGTPAIAFNVSGNTESIKNEYSGYICNTNEEIINKIINTDFKSLHNTSIKYSNEYNWTKQAGEFYTAIVN